jgi:hypothetical protein
VSTPIAHFISLEMLGGNLLRRLSLLAPCRHRPLVAMLRMELIIYGTTETIAAMKPWAGANE